MLRGYRISDIRYCSGGTMCRTGRFCRVKSVPGEAQWRAPSRAPLMAEVAAPECRMGCVYLPNRQAAEHTMAMRSQSRLSKVWTVEEFFAARDAAPRGERWELVDGMVLVTPSPNAHHQRVAFQLAIRLEAYVRGQGVGEIFVAPLDVRLEPSLVMQPDVLLAPKGSLHSYRGGAISHVSLAVEVLSPSSAKHDRVTKRPRYQRNGVEEYWIVDPDAETIERWTPNDERPAIVDQCLVWHPAGATEAFELDLIAFFREVSALRDESPL